MYRYLLQVLLLINLTSSTAYSADMHNRPWEIPSVPIVLDPYWQNDIDFDKVRSDPRVRAMIHKAGEGLDVDAKVIARAAQARAAGLLWGVYWLGRNTSDTKEQAQLLLDIAKKTDAKFLALDIEGTGGTNMTLEEAMRFAQHVFEVTGRYPALYTTFNVYSQISERYDSKSTFAKMPLWLARFQERIGLNNDRVWKDYQVWQFSSEINCKRNQTDCLYRVPGTQHDMDVNVFNGNYEQLKKAFQ